jgi:hypothetical protein
MRWEPSAAFFRGRSTSSFINYTDIGIVLLDNNKELRLIGARTSATRSVLFSLVSFSSPSGTPAVSDGPRERTHPQFVYSNVSSY